MRSGVWLQSFLALGLVIGYTTALRRRSAPSRQTTENDMLRRRSQACERMQCSHFELEAKATCTYKCVSEKCYDEIYAKDELEEGEVDERARLFSLCFKKHFRRDEEKRAQNARRSNPARSS